VQHETVTVAYLGWSGVSNGELLNAAEGAGFDVFVTGDRALAHQQNLAARKMAVVSLSANNWPIIRDYLTQIVSAIDSARSGSFVRVECGAFSRRDPRPRGPSLG
jgi:putative NIF3 family GTP cyclohydrolase 1 type 2